MPLTLFRRGKKGIFSYRGTIGPTGRRSFLSGSCNTTDKDVAARQIAQMEADYWKGHFDGPEAVLTFGAAARRYRAAGKSVTFLDPVENHLRDTLVKDITEGSVQQMAKELYPNCGGASLNRLVLVPVRAVINHCARSKLCQPLRLKDFDTDAKIKEPATLEWVEAFAANASPHLGAMVLFMYLTGARIGEAVEVQWADVDLKAQTVLIRESKVNKERMAHLPTRLVVALANIPRMPGRPVFLYNCSRDSASAWKAAVERAGIKRLSPHCCRHGFATGLLRRGVDVVTVAWLGGWKSAAQVLKTYGHANKNPRLTDLLIETKLEHEPSISVENPMKTGTT